MAGTAGLGPGLSKFIANARKRWFMKKVWNKPELRRLVAGRAEANVKAGLPDGANQANDRNFS